MLLPATAGGGGGGGSAAAPVPNIIITAIADQIDGTAVTLSLATVELDGVDRSGGVTGYAWRVNDATTGLSSPTVASPTFTPGTLGRTYTATCAVTIDGITYQSEPMSWDVGRVVYHLDWQDEAAQDFAAGGDGNYTIDGQTWAVSGTTVPSVAEINASGLVVTQASTNVFSVTIAASDLYGSISDDRRYVWMHRLSISGAGTEFEVIWSRWNNASDQQVAWVGIGYVAGAENVRLVGLSTTDVATSLPGGDCLLAAEVDAQACRARYQTGGTYSDPADVAVLADDTAARRGDRATDKVAIVAGCGNTVDGYTVTVKESWLVELE